jgi:hypothetical protein
MATTTMNMHKANRLKIVQAVVDGALRVGMAVQRAVPAPSFQRRH